MSLGGANGTNNTVEEATWQQTMEQKSACQQNERNTDHTDSFLDLGDLPL